MLPLIGALAPVGLLAGAAVGDSPVRDDVGLLGGVFVYGASGHLSALSLLGAGAGVLSVVAAVLVINARGLVYSAGLARALRHQPAWFRWSAPYLLVDPLFALVTRQVDRLSCAELRGYYLGAGIALWAAWIPIMAAGLLVGPALPSAAWIDFAIPSLFIAFLVPGLRGVGPVSAAVTGGVVALIAAGAPAGSGLVIATGAGTIAATAVEGAFR